jgi:hypothetical protein
MLFFWPFYLSFFILGNSFGYIFTNWANVFHLLVNLKPSQLSIIKYSVVYLIEWQCYISAFLAPFNHCCDVLCAVSVHLGEPYILVLAK